MLRLAAGVAFCLVVGMAAAMLVGHWWPEMDKTTKDFVTFVCGGLSFQGAALVLVHFFLREYDLGWRDGFGLSLAEWPRMMMLALLAILVVLPAAFALGKLTELLLLWAGQKPELQVAVKMLQGKLPAGQIVVYGLVAVVLAPVAEEVLFRGILYPTLKRTGHPLAALWITSLLFASIHLNLLAFVPLTFLALTLAWLYERTGNLLAPILTHVLFNGVNFTLLLLVPELVKGS